MAAVPKVAATAATAIRFIQVVIGSSFLTVRQDSDALHISHDAPQCGQVNAGFTELFPGAACALQMQANLNCKLDAAQL